VRKIVKILGLGNMRRVVELNLSGLRHLLLTVRDLVVQVPRNGQVADLRDVVRGDPPACHSNDPVVEREFVFSGLHELLEFGLLGGVG